MKDEKIDKVKLISVSLVWFIIFIISIIIVMVSKVEAAMSSIPLINFEGYSNNNFSGTPSCTQPNQCSDIRSFTARYQAQGTPLVVQNETYSIEFRLMAMPSYNPVPSAVVKPRIYFLVNNNWIQATPDRYENKSIINNCNETNLVCYTWSFELDSTIYTDIVQINVSFDYGWIEYFSSNYPVTFWIENLSIQSDTERILNGIDKQTSILQENNDGNTNRIINWAESFEDNWENNFNQKFNGGTNFEDSQEGTYQSTKDSFDLRERNLFGYYDTTSFTYRFFINLAANAMIWNIIETIFTGKLMVYILSVLSLGIICQILRRNKV